MLPWRLIPLINASGAFQMALDEWLLDQHQQGLHPPTLRFYTWHPAAISLGYHQRQWAQEWQNLDWKGRSIDLVRRPTGGRAVLHQGDLTYAVITSGLGGNRVQVYQTICAFLIQGWRSLGIDLHYGQTGRGYIHNPNCFGTATGADLVTPEGFKLIGSAQLYRGKAVLQHGSIRLRQDPDLFQKVFGIHSQFPSALLPLAEDELLPTVMETLIEAAQACFGCTFQIQPLSEAERSVILSRIQLWE